MHIKTCCSFVSLILVLVLVLCTSVYVFFLLLALHCYSWGTLEPLLYGVGALVFSTSKTKMSNDLWLKHPIPVILFMLHQSRVTISICSWEGSRWLKLSTIWSEKCFRPFWTSEEDTNNWHQSCKIILFHFCIFNYSISQSQSQSADRYNVKGCEFRPVHHCGHCDFDLGFSLALKWSNRPLLYRIHDMTPNQYLCIYLCFIYFIKFHIFFFQMFKCHPILKLNLFK